MKSYLVLISFLFFSSIGIAGKSPSVTEEQAKQFMNSQPVQFLENKGQMIDMNGKPAPFVLFKAEAPGIDMYITENGLTYVFNKTEEEENSTSLEKIGGRNDKENVKTEWSRIDMKLNGANIKKENVIKEGANAGFSQYFFAHCADGITNVHYYEKIIVKDIYPNIDWVLYNSDNKGFKYDFIVYPGADPKQIELVYCSLNPLKLNRKGEIEIKTGIGTLTENNPVSYQKGKEIPSSFIKTLNHQNNNGGYDTHIKFQLENYNSRETLTIDPQLVWSTYYGGNGLDGPMSIDCDPSGNILITGYLSSTNFPVLNPGGAYFQGAYPSLYGCLFIVKFNNSGIRIWATYYGGGYWDHGNSICSDPFGNIFVVGITQSANLPLLNPFGGAYFQGALVGASDFFILKFNAAGGRLWATYYGGNGDEFNSGERSRGSVCSDPFGNIFITGCTSSANLPVLNPLGGAYFQGASAGGTWDAFILKFNNSGVRIWATYYGGNNVDEGTAICTDPSGNVFVTGDTKSTNFPVLNPFGGVYFQGAKGGGNKENAFILKFDNTGISIWATYYGGTGGLNYGDFGLSIQSDQSGNICVSGIVSSANFPVMNPGGGAYYKGVHSNSGQPTGADAFLLKFDNAGVRKWATYLGGSGDEYFSSYHNIIFDPCGNVYASFNTTSTNVTFQSSCSTGFNRSTHSGGGWDLFIYKFSGVGALLWGTYLGGNSADARESMTIDKSGNLFMAGEWTGSGALYPLTDLGGGAYFDATQNGSDDGFIAKFTPPVLTLSPSVTSAGCSCTGTATVVAAGGCTPYKYSWYNNSWTGIGNTETINNLCPGNYQVIVRDTINCIMADTVVVTISGGGGLTLNNSTNNVLCNGDNTGSASVAPVGGIPNYTYSWSSGSTGQTATGLAAGNYTITVTDASGCSTTTAIVIISPQALIGQLVKGTANCIGCGCKEWAMVTATGGASPYSYLWSASGGYDGRYLNQLCPGPYTVNITDKNGCSINVNLSAP